MIRRRVIAYGVVQGVFFRDSCRREASRRGVSGWVRNREDGTVEAHFEGSPDAVDAMVAWMRTGPPDAVVDRLETSEEEPTGRSGFAVR